MGDTQRQNDSKVKTMSKWSEWCDIENAATRKGSFEDWGIYEIRIVNRDGVPYKIGRVVGVDSSGLSYVGRSGFRTARTTRTIANRIEEWLSVWHPGAAAYHNAKLLLDGAVPDHRLEVRAMFLSDEDIEDAEVGELRNYRRSYGELPPFNSADPDRWS